MQPIHFSTSLSYSYVLPWISEEITSTFYDGLNEGWNQKARVGVAPYVDWFRHELRVIDQPLHRPITACQQYYKGELAILVISSYSIDQQSRLI